MERAARTARCRSSSCSSGTVFYSGADGRLQVGRIGWDKEARYRLPVAVWREMMDRHFPGAAWLRLGATRSTRSPPTRRATCSCRWDETIEELLREAGRVTTADPVREIADAVLYEGYVLWPYRRSALKNRQRWTFGGVYPPGWSAEHRMIGGEVSASVRVEGASWRWGAVSAGGAAAGGVEGWPVDRRRRLSDVGRGG